jgi:hypothetical protein
MFNVKNKTNIELIKELSFIRGYLAYMTYENSLFKQYSDNYTMIKTELKNRHIKKYKKIRGF